MREGERNFRRMGIVGRVGIAAAVAACSSPSPTPAPKERDLDSFQYRVTFQTPADVYVQFYADRARFPQNPDGSTEDIIMVDVYCPSEDACEDLLERDNVAGSRVRLSEVDPRKYKQLEVSNQRNDYASCGKPVPSPFTVGDQC